MDIEKILMNEMDILRQELRHLKDCQIKYFLLSITSTITVIALATKFTEVSPYIFLTPLIVVLPCWWTFFDKASSITRIVGYYRILEKMLLHDGIHRYIGWEISLHTFRDYQNDKLFDPIEMTDRPKQLSNLFLLKTTHKYWMLNWYTFFSLVILSVALSAISLACATTLQKSNIHFPVFLFVLILVIHSSIANFRKVIELVFGHSSYTVNEKRWEQILRVDPNKSPIG